MRRLVCLALMLVAVPTFAQYPEVDAAFEAVTAKDLPTMAKHLPPGLEKGLAELSIAEQQELSKEMLPSLTLSREGLNVKRSDSPEAIAIIEAVDPTVGPIQKAIVKLDKRVSDGGESLLELSFRSGEKESGQFQVWMKYVDSEWRVYELQVPGERKRVNLDAPNFLAKIRHTELNSNEASAVGSMRSYNTAAITYASSYPDIGFPQTAEDLGVSKYGTDFDAHHAGLVDDKLATAPFEKSGYRYSFKVEKETFIVIARPIKFGVSGNRSFFSNESCVIRFTDEDREATENDPPLQ